MIKSILAFIGVLGVAKVVVGYGIDSFIKNITYIQGKLILDWSSMSVNVVKITIPVLITNQNTVPIDCDSFYGEIWYGEKLEDANGHILPNSGVKLSTIEIPVFDSIGYNQTGAINLKFDVNYSSLLNDAVSGVMSGGLGLTTVLHLYGYVNLVSNKSSLSFIKLPINIPINLVN